MLNPCIYVCLRAGKVRCCWRVISWRGLATTRTSSSASGELTGTSTFPAFLVSYVTRYYTFCSVYLPRTEDAMRNMLRIVWGSYEKAESRKKKNLKCRIDFFIYKF
jgi:hypothetical protein